MEEKKKIKIEKKHLILCEGVDEKYFLIHYLESGALSDQPFFSQDVQVEDFGGIHDLGDYLKTIQNMENFDQVKSILVIRDAEGDVQAAKQQVQGQFFRANITVSEKPCDWRRSGHFKCAYTFLPTCDENPTAGTLEDLCLKIIKESEADEIRREIKKFFDQLKTNCNRKFPREFKSELHTYFSVTDDYVGLKIGEATKAGAFSLESETLSSLKKIIASMDDPVICDR